MPYVPHTPADEKAMLDVIGSPSIDHLFREIPEGLRLRGELNIPSALDEHKLFGNLAELASRNVDLVRTKCFLGAGIYDRYIPASVGAVISRGEFLTAYTPYQPELSQGYLQTIYEFQSMVAELLGVDLANASMYDGATAMAEAAIMAHGITGRSKLAVSSAVHPHYRQVMDTYTWSVGLEVVSLDTTNGATSDFSALGSETACVIVQYPNFFGTIEDLASVRDAAKAVGAMFIVVADPTACALLKPPGAFDADIVVGEGQPLGIAMGFGGPLLGLFGCKQEHVRRIPGRIVGRTTDQDGRPGYAMTLRTREQDIRREKATSNICTNEALMALAATVYMSALGKNGMKTVAQASVQNTQYAIQRFAEAGIPLRFPNQRVFCEFVLQLPTSADRACERLLSDGFLAGLPLENYFQELGDCLLVAVTETRTRAEIEEFVKYLVKAVS
ncbi:MAG: aminomethyl-transferring glycine dehydrogenase subunit GcvPA [Fimbriimonadaceae bacterium]